MLPVEVLEYGERSGITRRETVIGVVPGQPQFRILIVEDQQENRVLLEQILGVTGFSVRAVENGAAAVEAFQTWHPDFIWMDWRMPVMDGCQATRYIRTLEGGDEVKIAGITASVSPDEREEMLRTGVNEFVRKPFRPEEVYDCMGRLLGVRYLYRTVEFSGSLDPRHLTSLDLAVLPASLRNEMADAIVHLDVASIRSLIDRAAELDAGLGEALRYHADRFAFTAILKLVRAADVPIEADRGS
jgi:CheY-like chemotaxis protein